MEGLVQWEERWWLRSHLFRLTAETSEASMSESDDSDWTPYPGEAVPADEAAFLVAAFERRFRVCTKDRHAKVPTWVVFAPSDSRRADVRVLSSGSIPDDAPVFLYQEGRTLRRTQLDDVRDYLAALMPWEDEDLYVFDASMTWCIALTHPQMGNERLVIVAGTFPPASTR